MENFDYPTTSHETIFVPKVGLSEKSIAVNAINLQIGSFELTKVYFKMFSIQSEKVTDFFCNIAFSSKTF